jgi:3-hydroxyisobutyrate dehydrogenase
MRVGLIGLGAMGAPIARNLAKAGLLEAVWNRTLAKAVNLARETGALVATGPADLARRCSVLVLSVSADSDMLEIIDALTPAVTEGTVVVDTSTVSAASAREAARRLASHGAVFLDAPVSGGVEGARQGTLSMMIGGDAAVVHRIQPMLETIATRILHMGPVGSGQATKAVNQIVAAGINQAVSEGLAFAEALGLPLNRVIEAVGGGAAANWFLEHRGPSMVQGDYPPGFRVALHHKDLGICQAMAEQIGARLPIVEMTLIHYRRLIDAGYGDEDISALHREKQALFEEET